MDISRGSLYVAIAAISSILQLVFLWRQDRRQSRYNKKDPNSSYDNVAKLLDSQIETRLISILVSKIVPMRELHLDRSADERLKMELELVLARADVSEPIRELYYDSFMLTMLSKRARRIRWINGIVIIAVAASLLYVVLFLIIPAITSSITVGPMSYIMIVILVESVLVGITLAVYTRRLKRIISQIADSANAETS